MLMRRLYILFVAICFAAFPAMLRAEICSVPIFAVNNIHLDEKGETGTIARKKAIEKASKDAFALIIRRMLVPGQDQSQTLTALNASEFVDFIYITDENALAQRYIATIDICFNGPRMRAAFSQRGLIWSELLSPPVLLLPIWETPSGLRIWAHDVLWLDSWRQSEAETDSLLRFTILEPKLAIERQLSPEKLFAKDADYLKQAARSAGAQQLVWLYAGIDYSQASSILKMEAEFYDSDGGFLAPIIERQIIIDQQTELSLVFERFRKDTITAMAASWKNANLYVVDQQEALYIEVLPDSFKNWYEIQGIFKRLPIVTSLSVVHLQAGRGGVELTLSGSIDALKLAIRAEGYHIEVGKSGYILKFNSP